MAKISKPFRPDTIVEIRCVEKERRTVEAEAYGAFRIHRAPFGHFGVTPCACGFSLGRFRSIDEAREACRRISSIPANWLADDPADVFANPETKRAAYDAIRELRI